MPKMGERHDRCQRDHDDWRFDSSKGTRYCHTCRTERNRRNRKPRQRKDRIPRIKPWASGESGDRGGRLDTYSWSEIMKARDYNV
jgi:hypothetical protein